MTVKSKVSELGLGFELLPTNNKKILAIDSLLAD